MELYVFVHQSRVPTVDEWQRAIREAGFDLTLDPTLDLHTSTGYSPAVYHGQETGFEFDLWPATEITDSYPDLAQQIGDRDMAANFRWGGDLLECAAAVIASAALAHLADGMLYDPQEDEMTTGEKSVELARKTAREIEDTG